MGASLILLSAIGFGSMALFAKLAYADGVDTSTLLAMRFAIATLLLGAFALHKRARFPCGRELAAYIAMGFIYAAMAWAYFNALHYTSSSTVAIVLYTYPTLVAIAAAILRIDRFGIAEALALIASSTGLHLVIGGSLHNLNFGAVLALTAGVFYACYILIGSRLKGPFDTTACSTVVLATTAVCFVVSSLFKGIHWPNGASGWAAILSVAVLGTSVAIAAFIAGLKRLGPTQTAILSTLEPVVTVALGIAFLAEEPTASAIGGGALILSAAIGLTIVRARNSKGKLMRLRNSPFRHDLPRTID
jgi:drug/metabolite transporter (DMT)-like permease